MAQQHDGAQASEGAMVGATYAPDGARMVGHLVIAKYWGDDRTLYPDPYEIMDGGLLSPSIAAMTRAE